jgi:hypothetical protein
VKKADDFLSEAFVDGGSGFSAANRFNACRADRGWKAAPTINPTLKALKLNPLRAGGHPAHTIVSGFLPVRLCHNSGNH